jgi:putative hydrolase of HD superfamily
MYRMSMMTFLAPYHLDRIKCMEMCLIHDLAESIVGDLTPADNVSKEEKAKLEDVLFKITNFFSPNLIIFIFFCYEIKEAMAKLIGFLGENSSISKHVKKVYAEYAAHESEEAHFVKSLDLLDMYLQAYEYELINPELDLTEFFATAEKFSFKSPVREWVKELLDLRATKAQILPKDSNLNTILRFYLKK